MPSKVYRTIPELVELLASRGLNIDVPAEVASDFLKGVNYYRFTGYALPFLESREAFRAGSQFSDVCAVYEFDRKLRHLLSEALSVVELTFRTNFARELARMLGEEAYLHAEAFRADEYVQALKLVRGDYSQSVERCAQHFKRLGVHPPIWALVDVTTFGHLSKLFRALKNEYRSPIAKIYGYTSSKAVCSLLQHLCVLRNRCAHHSRVYDLPWGQNDGVQDAEANALGITNSRRLYIFPELPEWTVLKRNGYSVPRFYPLFYQLALVYRFLIVTPPVVYNAYEWKRRVSDLLEHVPNVGAKGVDLKTLLQIPENVLKSPVWDFEGLVEGGHARPSVDPPCCIIGGNHIDARGVMRFCNAFNMDAVKRFYTISNSAEQPRRGWIMHKRETKWFFPLVGRTTVWISSVDGQVVGCDVPIAPQPHKFELKANEPVVLKVPPYHWFLIEQDGTAEVQVFSNCKVGEFPDDDFRKEDL